jgi:2-octaprenylphenol hydroxylase
VAWAYKLGIKKIIMKSSARQFDITIIGGGLVGATLACALSRGALARPVNIAIVDPQDFTSIQPVSPATEFDVRVSAITRASQNIFTAIGAWPFMAAQRISPFRHMHVWEQANVSEIHFDSAELSEAQLGHIIENRVMLSSLYDCLKQKQNVSFLFGQACQSMQLIDDQWQLEVAGETLQTRLLVGADGSQSWVRNQLGITTRGWDYNHTALVTTVKTELPHQETAWQRFLKTGPLAFLPLSKGYSSIVWSTQPEIATELAAMPVEDFKNELEQAFESRLGRILEVAQRACFPLRFFMADNYINEAAALVGDAAHTMHPLAGQGVNLGLLDAASLAQVIEQAVATGQDINSHKVLRRYERWRKAENLSMLVMVDQIQRLFGTENHWLKWMRNTGMHWFNQLSPVKHQIIDYAMGLHGDLPAIARPGGLQDG